MVLVGNGRHDLHRKPCQTSCLRATGLMKTRACRQRVSCPSCSLQPLIIMNPVALKLLLGRIDMRRCTQMRGLMAQACNLHFDARYQQRWTRGGARSGEAFHRITPDIHERSLGKSRSLASKRVLCCLNSGCTPCHAARPASDRRLASLPRGQCSLELSSSQLIGWFEVQVSRRLD